MGGCSHIPYPAADGKLKQVTSLNVLYLRYHFDTIATISPTIPADVIMPTSADGHRSAPAGCAVFPANFFAMEVGMCAHSLSRQRLLKMGSACCPSAER